MWLGDREVVVRILQRAGAVLAVGLLVACAPTEVPTTTPTPVASTTSPAPSPSPSPSPSPTETLDPDQVAARDVVMEFFRLMGALRKDPKLPIQALADITTGRAQEEYPAQIFGYWEKGWVQVGDILVTPEVVGAVEMRGEEKTIAVTVCVDNSSADVVDPATGESVLPADRQFVMRWVVDTVQEGTRWKVEDTSTQDIESCDQ